MSTSTGKIGRLPAAVRSEVNQMIRDNRTADSIIAYLVKSEGVKGVSPQNISSWKKHGYQEWLRRQERIERMQGRREFAEKLVTIEGKDAGSALSLPSEASAVLAVDLIQEVLEEFNPDLLNERLAEKPEKLIGLLDSLAMLRKGDQAFVKLKMEHEKFRAWVRESAQKLGAKAETGSVTKADVDAIFKEAYGA